MKDKCPCQNCICIPRCRFKLYEDFLKCSQIKYFLFEKNFSTIKKRRGDFEERMLETIKNIKPTTWSMEYWYEKESPTGFNIFIKYRRKYND
jgi:hypothetical protein